MKRILIPSSGPDSWRGLLADPELHWKPGASAHALASTWEAAEGFPLAVRDTLRDGAAWIADAEILLALPEWKVSLPPRGGRPTQTDLMILARTQTGSRVAIAVEGKVDEPFADPVADWRAKDPSPGKEERLAFLLRLLEFGHVNPGGLRYQLLHRTAAAALEANRFGAECAVMLVHSFSPEHRSWPDFTAFVDALGGSPVERGEMVEIPRANAPRLLLGWVSDRAPSGP